MRHDLAFQILARAAILAELSNQGDTTPVVGHANPNRALPYILIGESEAGDNEVGEMLTVMVHVYSNKEGAHEVKTLQSYINTALHAQNIEDSGVCYVNIRQEFATVNIEPDDESWHGVQRFTVLVNG